MLFHLVRSSSNAKTGPIPVSTTSADTCPSACPLKDKGCYAKSGPLGMHWAKVTSGDKRAVSFDAFLAAVRALPKGQLWRHNQAGDLPGVDNAIDTAMLAKLVSANRGRNGFTYTHKPLTPENAAAIRAANDAGFTVNVSTNNVSEVDAALAANVGPVVTILPSDVTTPYVTTAGGARVVVCPAQRREDISCATCGLCSKSERKVVVGFLAHGNSHKKVSKIAALAVL